jgi:hypothetical protein
MWGLLIHISTRFPSCAAAEPVFAWKEPQAPQTHPNLPYALWSFSYFAPDLNFLKCYRLCRRLWLPDLKDRGPDALSGSAGNKRQHAERVQRTESPFVVNIYVGDRKSGTALSNVLLLAICL